MNISIPTCHQELGVTSSVGRKDRRHRKIQRRSAARLEAHRRLILDIRQMRFEIQGFPLRVARIFGQLRKVAHREENDGPELE